MAEKKERGPASDSRIVVTAIFHAALFVLFIIFLGYIVPQFVAMTSRSNAELPASAQVVIRLTDFVNHQWYWAIPLAAVLDTAALFAVARAFGKRGLLVWSVILSGVFAGLMILGMTGILNAVARMG